MVIQGGSYTRIVFDKVFEAFPSPEIIDEKGGIKEYHILILVFRRDSVENASISSRTLLSLRQPKYFFRSISFLFKSESITSE